MTPHDKPDDSIASPRAETHGEFSIFMPEPAKRPGLAARQVLLAGVAAACLLGVGLGIWARPAMSERQASLAVPGAAPAKVAPAARRLAIVVDDRPAPLGAPIDVLPKAGAPAQPPAAPQFAPPPVSSPVQLPEGLMRVQNIVSPTPTPTPVESAAAAAPAPERKPVFAPLAATAASAVAAAKLMLVRARAHDEPPAEVAPAQIAKADAPRKVVQTPARKAAAKAAAQAMADAAATQAAPKAAAHKVELARAAQLKATEAKAEAHKVELAQAAQDARAEKHARLQAAKAVLAKAEAHKLQVAQDAQDAKAEKQAHLQAAKAQRLQQIQLAKAEAKGRAEALAEAKTQALAEARADERKRERLAALAHAVQHLLPHQAKAPAAVEDAKLDRKHAKKSRHELQIEQASLKTHRQVRLAEAPPRTHAAPIPPPAAHASGLMKVSAPRCANRDPGEALVCADPSLGAADRQMARAYQVARNAGVPDAQLQRQQQRWLAARSAAAREAPWAVHDVYLARIAELNGQARDADVDGH